jgi:hypothetical protein
LFADEEDKQIFIYEGSDVNVYSFSEIMNSLQTANASSRSAMDIEYIRLSNRYCQMVTNCQHLMMAIAQDVAKKNPRHCSAHSRVLSGLRPSIRTLEEMSDVSPTLRYFQSDTGRLVPVNMFRSIPIGAQLRLLFANRTIAPAMRMQ